MTERGLPSWLPIPPGARQRAKDILIATGAYRHARALEELIRRRDAQRVLREEIALYTALHLDGALCFDVGANIGIRAEALLRAGANVVAFEPDTRCVRELEARCAPWSNRLTTISAALGAAPAISALHVRAAAAHSSLDHEWETDVPRLFDRDVPVLTLDVAIARFGLPRYCKIDVEGYELHVLRGLTAAIPFVSIEYHLTPRDLAKTRECIAHLRGLGSRHYNVMRAERPGIALPEWLPLDSFDDSFPGSVPRDELTYGDLIVALEAPPAPTSVSRAPHAS